jgi:uncharacterized repeat protein (TIGR04076 family)
MRKEMHRGKVTVLRRMSNPDLIEAYEHETVAPCPRFEDGQTFVIEDWETLPKGFCAWAWADLGKKIALAEKLGVVIACCTDGFRPVVFEIERRG